MSRYITPIITCSVLLAFFTFHCKSTKHVAPDPMIQWQKVFGKISDDYPCIIRQIKDGGYIVAATCDSLSLNSVITHGKKDYWVAMLNSDGNVQWRKSFGGSDDDEATSIQPTKDGGYIIAGESNSDFWDVSGAKINHGGYDYWVVKIDSVGAIQWQKFYGGSNDDFATSIQQTNDGGFIICGGSGSNDGDVTGHHGSVSKSDYWIVKIDPVGVIQWQKSYGGSNNDIAVDIRQTRNGDYIIVGMSYSVDGDVGNHHGSDSTTDHWVLEIDPLGTIKWGNSYGGSNNDVPTSIVQNSDGGFIIAGNSHSSDGNVLGHHGVDSLSDCWVLKIDSVGTIKWQRSYGGSGDDLINSLVPSEDGGFIMVGSSNSADADVIGNHGNYDCWIVKINEQGMMQWQKFLGGSEVDEAYSIQQTNDEGYIMAGITMSNNGDVVNYTSGIEYWIVKLKNSPDK